jgi:KDO2-lipid IV(A) lauroyltransferase
VASLQPGFWGKFFYHCLPLRKRIVLANLQYVFGNVLSQQEIKKLAQCFYLHFFRTLGENIAMRFMSEQQVCDQAVVVGKEIPLKVAEQNKGMAILTAHIGNWELAPIAGILNFKQFQGRFHFIRRNQIKIVEHIFFRRFHRAGLQI